MVYTSEPIYISSFIRAYLLRVFIFGEPECIEKNKTNTFRFNCVDDDDDGDDDSGKQNFSSVKTLFTF